VAEIGLRDKLGTANRMVYADVTGPDGSAARNGTILVADGWGKLAYPTAFRAAPPLGAGTYTVVWRDTISDRFIACDGFVVEPA
jgi:methionine-rich copper-binding protein CopC